jgi:hypothetical protein
MTHLCELRILGGCAGPLQVHHILNRGKLNAIDGWKDYCEKEHPHIFLAHICAAHNVSRIADTKWARALLLKKRVNLFGGEYVAGVLDELRRKSKTGIPEWRLEALMEFVR